MYVIRYILLALLLTFAKILSVGSCTKTLRDNARVRIFVFCLNLTSRKEVPIKKNEVPIKKNPRSYVLGMGQ